VIDTFAGQAYVIIIRWTYAKIRELLVLHLPIGSPNPHLPLPRRVSLGEALLEE